jgi:hypothetical protein
VSLFVSLLAAAWASYPVIMRAADAALVEKGASLYQLQRMSRRSFA